MDPKVPSLYVHVPFCTAICPYCDFPKVVYRESWSRAYLSRLQEEAKARCDGTFSTVYVGGGTPSCLKAEEFDELLSFFRGYLEEGGEYSVEINPETLTEEKADILARHGINRVSLGVQSFHPKTLKTLGRRHDEATVVRAISLLRERGIANINLDWMYGVPGQTREDVAYDIARFLAMDVPHVSAYSLILEEGTIFAAKKIEPCSDDVQQGMFESIRDALEQAGIKRYEVSNFAREGYRCRHNLTYWRDEHYLAVGLGASGYVGDERYVNTKNLTKYLAGEYEGERETLSVQSRIEDFLLTNLRLVEGFEIRRFEERFGPEAYGSKKEAVDALKGRGLLEEEGGYLRTTSRGMDLLDAVLLELF